MGLTNPQSADHIAAEAGSFDPQRQNNFSVEISLEGSDRDLIIMGLRGFTLPAQTNEVINIPYQNEMRKLAGQVTVEESTLTLHDYVDQDVRGALLRWRKRVYDPSTGKIGKASDYKKTLNVIMSGPDGGDIRVAKLIGAFPSGDPPVELNMEGSEGILMEIPLSIDKISWADSITGA